MVLFLGKKLFFMSSIYYLVDVSHPIYFEPHLT